MNSVTTKRSISMGRVEVLLMPMQMQTSAHHRALLWGTLQAPLTTCVSVCSYLCMRCGLWPMQDLVLTASGLDIQC